MFDRRLREKCGGSLVGMPMLTFKSNAEKAGMNIRMYAPKDGERWQDVMDRAENFLQEMADRFIPAKPVNPGSYRLLMVTSGGFIGEFFNVIRKYQGKPPIYNNSAKNCALFIVRF